MSSRDSFADEVIEEEGLVNGGSVDWRGLARTLFGGLFLTLVTTPIMVGLAIQQEVTGLLGGLAAWGAELVDVSLGTPGDVIAATAGEAVEWVPQFGPLAAVAAVVLVLAGLWGIAWVLDRGVG